MDLQRMLGPIGRMVMRRLMSWGINKGVDLAAGKGKPAAQMTPAERQMAKKGRNAVKLARQAARITRRMGR